MDKKLKTNKSCISSLKDLVYEWVDTGTSRIILVSQKNQILLKLAYLFVASCFILISTSYCVFSVWTSLNKYFQYDTVTRIKIVQEVPTNFPAVTFCILKQSWKQFNTNYTHSNISKIILHCEFNWQDCIESDFKNFFDSQFGELKL